MHTRSCNFLVHIVQLLCSVICVLRAAEQFNSSLLDFVLNQGLNTKQMHIPTPRSLNKIWHIMHHTLLVKI